MYHIFRGDGNGFSARGYPIKGVILPYFIPKDFREDSRRSFQSCLAGPVPSGGTTCPPKEKRLRAKGDRKARTISRPHGRAVGPQRLFRAGIAARRARAALVSTLANRLLPLDEVSAEESATATGAPGGDAQRGQDQLRPPDGAQRGSLGERRGSLPVLRARGQRSPGTLLSRWKARSQRGHPRPAPPERLRRLLALGAKASQVEPGRAWHARPSAGLGD